MKYLTLLALTIILAGCGGAQEAADTALNSPTDNNTPDPTLPPENDPQNVGQPQDPMPGNDPIQNRTYTNTYGNNFCDNQPSDLQCWGDIDFHAGTAVAKLLMGRDAICYAPTSFQAGIECYSATLGPITMDAHKISNFQNSSLQTFMNLTVNAQGQMCFKVAEWHGTPATIYAIYNVCGFAPTADGDIQ